MTETIKTKAFKKERSQYQLHLLKSEQGHYDIELSQTVDEVFLETQTISLRESDFDKLISLINELKSDIEEHKGEQTGIRPNSEKAKSIIGRYYKNMSIQDISLTLGLKEKLVEKVLLEHNVPIVDNTPPSKKYFKKRRK